MYRNKDIFGMRLRVRMTVSSEGEKWRGKGASVGFGRGPWCVKGSQADSNFLDNSQHSDFYGKK